jgi:hypothetical protein
MLSHATIAKVASKTHKAMRDVSRLETITLGPVGFGVGPNLADRVTIELLTNVKT